MRVTESTRARLLGLGTWLLGLLFLAAAALKALEFNAFVQQIGRYQLVPDSLGPWAAGFLIAAEALLGEFCLAGFQLGRALRGQALYTYIEWLHRDLLGRRFVAFARAFVDRQVVAGCLLRRFSPAGAYDGEGPPDEDSALREENTIGVALCAAHPRFASPELYTSLLARAAEWAGRAGYSFLAAAAEPGLVVDGGREDAAWLFGSATTPVLHRGVGALLYCDLSRCSYLSRDFYFYSCEGPEPCLHYVANVPPGASSAVPFLRSLKGIRKLAHTRHGETLRALSQAGFDCELL